MGWLVLLIAVLLMLTVTAAGFWVSGVARSKNSRARGPFVAGVVCGVMVGTALAAKRRGLNAAGASTLKALTGPVRADFVASIGGIAAGALAVVTSLARHRPAPVIHEYGKYCVATGSRVLGIITRGVADRIRT